MSVMLSASNCLDWICKITNTSIQDSLKNIENYFSGEGQSVGVLSSKVTDIGKNVHSNSEMNISNTKELREATLIDGANELQILIRVYMPLNWGITSALALVTFIGAWNNFFWPFIMTTDPELYTITSGMAQVYTNYGIQNAYQMAMAMAAITRAPIPTAALPKKESPSCFS